MDKKVEPVTDDAELSKVLESMNDASVSNGGLSFEETLAPPMVPTPVMPADGALPLPDPVVAPSDDSAVAGAIPAPSMPMPTGPAPSDGDAAVTQVDPPMSFGSPQHSTNSDPALESIKKDALTELRPLVDKLNLPADEKFDTLLLIIRSTDDKSLVSQAHEAAKAIEDETKRAEALLDIIKEIDYFSNPSVGQPQ